MSYYAFEGLIPVVHPEAYVHPSAVLIGDVIVGAMSFVKAGFVGAPRQLLVGAPARVKRDVTDEELHWKRLNTQEYQDLAVRCRASLCETQPLTLVEKNRPRLKGTTEVKPKSA